jgi:hypothetical protein
MSCALAVLVGVVALAGCGAGHIHVSSVPVSTPTLPNPNAAIIQAARASNADLFRIFPAELAKRTCAIPVGSTGETLKGTCETSYYAGVMRGQCDSELVTFRETWGLRHSSSWDVPVSCTDGGTAVHHGERPPQADG